ncbi:MAG TPA: hypothetical protein PKY59_12680 [Pyrinomonadaceae bacterium]|nr:hypothetical protein [Pyrinomonadaceae bacterium]
MKKDSQLIVDPNKKTPELVPIVKEPLTPQENLAAIIGQIGEVVVAAVTEDAAGKTERARIEMPLKQEQIKLQQIQVQNYHEAQMAAQTAYFSKQSKELIITSVITLLVLLFLISIGGFSFYTGDKSTGMSIVTLLLGLLGGFLGGAGWQKIKDQSASHDNKN